jgi:hypothetical protein
MQGHVVASSYELAPCGLPYRSRFAPIPLGGLDSTSEGAVG